ncbi:MAG: acyl-CoA thioesterase/bile acid-CoA:amino acid N-acyltransferase family protein, partial [Gemmatimonadaceae bacterium]|nr:acyl-CoA thioesterase/bile acid-CoA:amino acid N-acyltransferase family protein [Gemmatimonadaceae bacterium]
MSRQTRSLAAVLLVAVACRSAATVPEVPQLVRTAGDTLRRGELPGLRIVGLRPGASVELLASRLVVLERRDTTPAVPDTVLLAARVRFIADRRGRVVVDSQAPVEGDWQGVEPLGLLWAMRRAGPDMMRPSGLRPGQLDLAATVRGAVISRRRLVLASASAGDARVVLGDGFAGAFAAPTAGGRHPALIALHGSEGGDTTAALALSRQFAALGYATFAVTYVAYGWTGGLPGVPAAFDSIPVETLDRVHQWMGRQANADTSRTGLWGVSKGAEFALVTAARRPWPRAVVACVGSDVMWAGFGRPAPAYGVLTSWADSGGRL